LEIGGFRIRGEGIAVCRNMTREIRGFTVLGFRV